MIASFDDFAAVKDENQIGILNRREPVGNGNRRSTTPHPVEGELDTLLGLGVNRTRRLIQNQDFWISGDRPGEGEQLSFPA